jgi:hypothetical protein
VQRQEPQPGKGIGVDVVSDSDAKHGDISGFRAGQVPQQQPSRIQQNIIADASRQLLDGGRNLWQGPGD